MLRRVVSRVPAKRVNVSQTRKMGGGGPPPPTDGLEGAVRKFLPKNSHMALGIIGFYTFFYQASKLFGGKKEATTVVATATGGTGMPSSDSAEFSDWLGQEGNFEKMLNADSD